MKKSVWKTYLLCILAAEAVGALAGFLIRDGLQIYSTTILKPPLSPPAIAFPIVWTVLYALMGVSSARVYLTEPSAARMSGIFLYITQLTFNFFWSILFFNLQAFDAAFFWLVILLVQIVLMIMSFKKVDATAAYLQIPYLLWVTFAGYLNFGVWMLNK